MFFWFFWFRIKKCITLFLITRLLFHILTNNQLIRFVDLSIYCASLWCFLFDLQMHRMVSSPSDLKENEKKQTNKKNELGFVAVHVECTLFLAFACRTLMKTTTNIYIRSCYFMWPASKKVHHWQEMRQKRVGTDTDQHQQLPSALLTAVVTLLKGLCVRLWGGGKVRFPPTLQLRRYPHKNFFLRLFSVFFVMINNNCNQLPLVWLPAELWLELSNGWQQAWAVVPFFPGLIWVISLADTS